MNDSKIDASKYAWVAMVAVFLLVFGGVWIASAPRESPPAVEQATKPEPPAYETFDRSYTAPVPMAAPMPPAPVLGQTGPPPTERPTVVVTPVVPSQNATPRAATKAAKPKPREVTPRDMFPVGDITKDLPKLSHPYRQVAELYPSFEYNGKLWSATGRYMLSTEGDLVPTGLQLSTGQHLYALPGDASNGALFVRSERDPGKFAIYRPS